MQGYPMGEAEGARVVHLNATPVAAEEEASARTNPLDDTGVSMYFAVAALRA